MRVLPQYYIGQQEWSSLDQILQAEEPLLIVDRSCLNLLGAGALFDLLLPLWDFSKCKQHEFVYLLLNLRCIIAFLIIFLDLFYLSFNHLLLELHVSIENDAEVTCSRH